MLKSGTLFTGLCYIHAAGNSILNRGTGLLYKMEVIWGPIIFNYWSLYIQFQENRLNLLTILSKIWGGGEKFSDFASLLAHLKLIRMVAGVVMPGNQASPKLLLGVTQEQAYAEDHF